MRFHVWISVLLVVTLAGAAGCRKHAETAKGDPLLTAYDTEVDWTDAQHVIPLSYEQAQGKRIFYQQCVWCPAAAKPAGPSTCSNTTRVPPLSENGVTLTPS